MAMSFELSEEHRSIRDSVRAFAENEVRPRAAGLDAQETFSAELLVKMGELGLLGMTVPEDLGGKGLDTLAYILAVEELARVDGSQAATIAAHNSLGVNPIVEFGDERQKRQFVPRLCRDQVWAFGLTEPGAGSDAGGTKTTATRKNGKWVLNGSKIFITNGSASCTAGVTVQAVTGTRPDGKKEYTCFLVETGTPGFTSRTMTGKMVWRGANTAELFFDGVELTDAQILGKVGDGFKQMLATLDAGRLSIAAMGLGCAQGAFEQGLAYARERRQFGQAIASFQINAFKLADMATSIEHARLFLYYAGWLKDQGRPFSKEAAMAKLRCSEVAGACVDHALQLHGGYGFMDDFPIGRFFRDQRLLLVGEGTSEIQRLVIARALGCFED